MNPATLNVTTDFIGQIGLMRRESISELEKRLEKRENSDPYAHQIKEAGKLEGVIKGISCHSNR